VVTGANVINIYGCKFIALHFFKDICGFSCEIFLQFLGEKFMSVNDDNIKSRQCRRNAISSNKTASLTDYLSRLNLVKTSKVFSSTFCQSHVETTVIYCSLETWQQQVMFSFSEC
jgi:hypothetical protein